MALIALPCPGRPIVPPLTLAYIATLLEQRRHIVRIYDLALAPEISLAVAIQPLRSFRPQIVVVAGEQDQLLEDAVEALHDEQHTHVLPVQMSRSGLDVCGVSAGLLSLIEHQQGVRPAPTSTPPAQNTLDQLPFPARHLLSLESYDLRAVGGELQTTLLVGSLVGDDGQIVLRTPAQIIAELRSVSHEFGLRHFLFADVPLTLDRTWLIELLTRLCDANLGVGWEGTVDADLLDEPLVAHIGRSGCEMLNFQLEASRVFESVTRERLRHVVAVAREHGISMRAHVKLAPPYESIPHLVDVAATFGLDDVRFDIAQAEAVGAGPDSSQLKALARQRYDAGRDRQRFINRFGPALGNLIWKLRGSRPPPAPGFDDEGITA
jgi:hypothetical protein